MYRGVFVKSKMKIEVRNEVCPPPPRAAYPRGLRLGRNPVVVIGILAPFTPRGVGISGKLLFSRSRVVNAFVCMDNGLPAALPHASPRLKIPMAPHWCCRVNPRAGYPGSRYLGKTLVLEKLGIKVQGGLGEVQNEDWGSKRSLVPRASHPRGLRLGRDPVVVIGIVAPFIPRGSVFRENSYSRDPGG